MSVMTARDLGVFLDRIQDATTAPELQRIADDAVGVYLSDAGTLRLVALVQLKLERLRRPPGEI